MKKTKFLAIVTTVALVISLIGCTNPSSSENTDNSNSSSENTNSDSDNPENDNDSGDAGTDTEPEGETDNGGDSTENPTPQYEWLYIGNEIITNQSTDTYDYSSNMVSESTYLYYNSAYDYKCTSLTQITSATTSGKGTEQETTTSLESESKSVGTYSKNGDIINSTGQAYYKNNGNWELRSEYTNEYYKNTWLGQYSHFKMYGYTVTSNGVETEIPGTESETNYTVELLSNSNGVEQYKVTDNSSPSGYTICEFKNNIIHQIVNYFSTGSFLRSESIYTQPDNSIIQNELPTFVLLSYKYYDSEDNIISEYQETVEDVTIDDTLGILKIKIGKTSNTESNYTYSISTYKKMQVPFSNE